MVGSALLSLFVFMPAGPLQNLIVATLPSKGITKVQFINASDRVLKVAGVATSAYGQKLIVKRSWIDPEVNASAGVTLTGKWLMTLSGGLARLEGMTQDGYELVLCHELGHLVGGFPYFPSTNIFIEEDLTSEGQSDYWATQTCIKEVWKDDLIVESNLEQKFKDKCNKVYASALDRSICYRSLEASVSNFVTLAKSSKRKEPSLDLKDTEEVKKTNFRHPKYQCRLDTSVAGSLCVNNLDITQKSPTTEKTALEQSCVEEHDARPRCWFAPSDE